MAQSIQGSTNQLGQFTDEFKDQASRVVDSPKKILEQILGGKPNKGMEDLEQGKSATDDHQASALKIQQEFSKKLEEEQKKKQELIQFHQQKLREEVEFHEQQKQKAEMVKQEEEQKEKNKETDEIIQLQHEKQKQDVLGSVIAQSQGSKETKAWGAG